MSENVYSTAPEEGFIAPFAADEESPYIFISYAHKDRERVFPIITRLYEQGWKIWYDEGLPLGEDYYDQLAAHIRNCEVMLLFVTHKSVASTFVTKRELEYGVRHNRRIVFCQLDEGAKIPDGIELATADYKSNPRTDDAGLEAALRTVKGLKPGVPRDAEPFKVGGNDRVLTVDGGEYLFVKCNGGVRLTKYLGSDTDVVVPAEYPAGSGQKVVELEGTFYSNKTVRTVRLPATVKSIDVWTFSHCTSLTDVYIPSSVTYLDSLAFGLEGKIHCAEGSAALDYAIEKAMDYLIDDSLAVTDDSADDTAQTAYAYISYSADMKERAAEIIGAIEKHNCVVFDGGRTSGVGETVGAINECTCFVALVSNDYIAGADIQFFRMASKMNKPKLLYVLEACELPPDLSIENDSQQQLRYDSLNEEQRTAKLIDWLQENGCRRVSADIPDFEYTATKENGITLTKYTGNGGDVVIPREHGELPRLPITSIGYGAFSDCSSLTGITIPDSVTSIGEWAFDSCSSLTGITIPNSVTSIGDEAFHYCSSLTGIAIPDSVDGIGDSAFRGCSSLTDISVNDNNINYCDINGVLFSKDKTLLIAYPGGRCGDYSVPDSVTSIGYGAFYGCRSLTGITIPDSVTRIGDSAFCDCRSLTGITIPDSVTSIGDEAFRYCSSLTGITIPDSVTRIGGWAFSGCPNLTVNCTENSYAWQYCEKNKIKHTPLSSAPEHSAEPEESTATKQAETPMPAVDTPATPAEPSAETAPSSTPRKKSPARWLVPLLILLALAAAAGLQLSGLVDIIGLLGL